MKKDDYLKLVTSYHRNKPKFQATLEAIIKNVIAAGSFLRDLPSIFDIDKAIGAQLDIVGIWVGRSRRVEIPLRNVWFSFDTEGLGVDQGSWKGPYDLENEMTELDDDNYRILLKAKIAANHWDGTLATAKQILEPVFGGDGTIVFIQDNMDMSMIIGVSGKVPSAVMLSLLANGYIPLKPEGVRVHYRVVSISNTPMFGFDIENEFIQGFDIGSWGIPPGQVYN